MTIELVEEKGNVSFKVDGVFRSDVDKLTYEINNYVKLFKFKESEELDDNGDEIDEKILNKIITKVIKENKDDFKEVLAFAVPKNKTVAIGY